MSVIISGDTGLAGAATGALNGTLGATTPSTVAATTISGTDLTTTGNTILGNASTDTLNVGNGGLVKDASGNVGIGVTPSGTYKLEVTGKISSTGTHYYLGTAATNSNFLNVTGTTTGSAYAAISNTIGSLVWGVSNSIGSVFAGATAYAGVIGTTGATPMQFAVNNSIAMTLDTSGNLTILGATATKASGTTWANPSDIRLKDNVTDYSKGLAELMQVNVKEWIYNGKGGTTEGMKGLGVIADEVILVLPNTVDTYQTKLNADDELDTNIKKFDATEITWLMLNSIKELNAKFEEYKASHP